MNINVTTNCGIHLPIWLASAIPKYIPGFG